MSKSKKKSAKPATELRKVASLTGSELESIASKLRAFGGNVYNLLPAGVEKDEAIFDRLKTEKNLFKCEMCDEWMDLNERDEGCSDESDICTECMDK
jgi:hypothetical protein